MKNGLLLTSLRKFHKKVFLKIILVITSILFTFLVAEMVLRLVYEFRFSPRGRAALPISKTYRLSKNKKLLYELLPNSKKEINGIEFKINSFGFRDKKYFLTKRNDKRLIFIGDSITYGWMLPLDGTYHKQLERLLQSGGYDVDVMGMGVVGYNTIQEYHLIKKRALIFKPDMIVLQICPNDFERTLTIKKYRKAKRLVLVPYHDLAIPYIVTKKGWVSHSFMRYSHFYKFMNLKLYWLIKKFNKNYTPGDFYMMGEENSFHYLGKIKKLLEKNNILLSVVIFPFKKMKKTYSHASLHKKIHKQLETMHIPFIDLYEDFNKKGIKDLWTDRLHVNEKGHRIAAHRMLDFIVKLLYDMENSENIFQIRSTEVRNYSVFQSSVTFWVASGEIFLSNVRNCAQFLSPVLADSGILRSLRGTKGRNPLR